MNYRHICSVLCFTGSPGIKLLKAFEEFGYVNLSDSVGPVPLANLPELQHLPEYMRAGNGGLLWIAKVSAMNCCVVMFNDDVAKSVVGMCRCSTKAESTSIT